MGFNEANELRQRMQRETAAIIATALGAVVVAFAFVTYGTSAEHSARVRNSLLATIGTEADLEWSPTEVPDSFLIETRAPPELFVGVVSGLVAERDSDKGNVMDLALSIARHLVSNKEHGGAIRSDSISAYSGIVDGGLGYCADYSQVYSGLAIAAGIPVREWGIGFDGFGFGHTVNEVYDDRYGKWVLIDSFHSLYVISKETGIPLSVLEFQASLGSAEAEAQLTFVPISIDKYAFKSDSDAITYYRQGEGQFYLVWGNNVFSYDENTLVRTLGPISRALETSAAIATGIHPSIRILRTTDNEEHIRMLEWTRTRFLALFAGVLILSICLAYQIWRRMRRGVH